MEFEAEVEMKGQGSESMLSPEDCCEEVGARLSWDPSDWSRLLRALEQQQLRL